MNYNEVEDVLEELRVATRHLIPSANENRFDLNQIEKAVAQREHSVARLRKITENHPDAFTSQDLKELQRILAEGKRASEKLMDMRRQGWTTATELRKKDFVMKTFLRFGSQPSAS